MEKAVAQKKIEELSKELHEHNHLYYVLSSPLISDFQFDTMLKELQDLEDQFPEFLLSNSPSKRVGGAVTKEFTSVKHKYRMLSLGNSYSKEDLIDFETRIRKLLEEEVEYVCELKYDGVAIGLRYVDGKLIQAVTRGDGTSGDDVTTNVQTIGSVPLELKGDYPKEFEIRGEIFMPLKAFEKLNKEKAKAGEPLMANPRNTASGTIKMQSSKIVAKRGLDCYLYYMLGEELPTDTHFGNLEKAGEWGFKVPNVSDRMIEKTNSIEGILDFINFWDDKRKDLPFEVDGVVIKVNRHDRQQRLGFTSKSPRWAISYKFETEQAVTSLNSVSYQVGRTGALTPVANLEPVSLLGTTVKRASLHNKDQIEKLDLYIKDQVFVEKGGEIIPKVVGVNKSARPDSAIKIDYITECPECETELVRKEGEANHYCPNENGCPPQITGKIEHFISRKAMNIDGLGGETVEQFFKAGLINNIADLYSLDPLKMISLDRMADKSVNKIIKGVRESLSIPFEQVLFAIGIRFVGSTVAKTLAKYFKNIQNIKNATLEELINVDEIGDKIAESVQEFFIDDKNLEIVNRLTEAGVQMAIIETEEEANLVKVLEGKSIVVSGVFYQFSRDELKKTIEKYGGKNVGSISKKTTFIVAGDKMGPSKLEKAAKLGVQLVSEEEFIAMISEG
ncbi:MAG: NAD-dependent DNA ligase LigA [Flavobacteriales bacterium]|nr:NAD-dependent DNA ligase LigA [Flavobacteriales bacterium]